MTSPALQRSFVDARLHVVTGKGGTGKTTVAAALALALAAQGRRVLLAEVEGRQGISQTFDVPPLGDDEVTATGLPRTRTLPERLHPSLTRAWSR